MRKMGFSYDWSKEIDTHKPEYYRWNQWLFLQFYKKGLVYRKKATINWCPSCITAIANEQVVDGKCERCSTIAVKKESEQWFFKITNYAEKLLKDLENLGFWPENVRKMQENSLNSMPFWCIMTRLA